MRRIDAVHKDETGRYPIENESVIVPCICCDKLLKVHWTYMGEWRSRHITKCFECLEKRAKPLEKYL